MGKPDLDPNGNEIIRCKIADSDIKYSKLKKCEFHNCTLSHVRIARRSIASDSQFHNARSVKRSQVYESSVSDQSIVFHSSVELSTIRDASVAKGSIVKKSTLSKTRLWRSTLADCEAENAIIRNSKFEGMILKNGIWKKNKLVQRMGTEEPVVVRRDGSVVGGPQNYDHLPVASEKDIKGDKEEAHEHDSDSDDSDHEKHAPPPYKA